MAPRPATAEFSGVSKAVLGGIATGKVPADIAQPRTAAAPAGPRRRVAPVARTGITFAGTVKNYTPVTDAMMVNPPDGDWLMHYRNYAGWSHSPLKQIDTANVGSLQLKWVLAMDEGERQQITPLVHDGVMFVSVNRTNKVQAIDAKTGTLIWENTLGPDQENIQNATRTMVLVWRQGVLPPPPTPSFMPWMRAPARSTGRSRYPTMATTRSAG